MPEDPYKLFLESPSVMSLASARLPDDGMFAGFLAAVLGLTSRQQDELSGRRIQKPLDWFLFEEIGWAVGAGYVFKSLFDKDWSAGRHHYIPSLRVENLDRIDAGLDGRRRHWGNPSTGEFVLAHSLLLGLLAKEFPALQD